MPVFLSPALPDCENGARLGGAPPTVIETHPLLESHRYVLTLAAGCASWTGGREVSVVLRAGFSIEDEDLVYPELAMRAIVHDPSPRGVRDDLGWPGLRATSLVEPPAAASTPPLVRVDDAPVLIQGELAYSDAVRADGHRFLFQIDEEGWPASGELGDIVEEYLWGYGSVYFYGTPGVDGTVHGVVAGFIDF
ncbi:hypothetical protein EDF62_2333 [Leucobacter luti]|uniref:Uncharacterized protein n=1 Tax=Leucobacter luti TaxID=340320 RepID=A0A4R6RXY0_9MICO|nr:hypothetical protein EDF62_2333 [Leucobacter luti]